NSTASQPSGCGPLRVPHATHSGEHVTWQTPRTFHGLPGAPPVEGGADNEAERASRRTPSQPGASSGPVGRIPLEESSHAGLTRPTSEPRYTRRLSVRPLHGSAWKMHQPRFSAP